VFQVINAWGKLSSCVKRGGIAGLNFSGTKQLPKMIAFRLCIMARRTCLQAVFAKVSAFYPILS
jgi:hypothetical protein